MTTVSDPEGRDTVLQLLPGRLRRGVKPVGRLDVQTEGLLLLTDDGDLARTVTHPSTGCSKEYSVKVAGEPSPGDLDKLRRGIFLEGVRTRPCDIERVSGTPRRGEAEGNTWLRVTLREGRSRQIRRMFAALGHPVSKSSAWRSVRSATTPLKLFKSYGFYKDQCPIWQAARATSAAPAFFPAAWVDVPSPGGWYIDGGVRANNPSYEAMLEGKKHWKTRKCFMVSIGTGFQKPADFIGDKQAPGAMKTGGSAIESKSPESDAAQNVEVDQSIFGGVKSGLMKASATIGGMIKAATGRVQSVTDKAGQMTRIPGGIKTVARILETLATLSTNSEHTHRRVWEEAHSEDESLQFPYFRFNVPRGMEKIGLEEWKATEKITALTRSYLESPDVKKELENCAEGLWNPSAIEST